MYSNKKQKNRRVYFQWAWTVYDGPEATVGPKIIDPPKIIPILSQNELWSKHIQIAWNFEDMLRLQWEAMVKFSALCHGVWRGN